MYSNEAAIDKLEVIHCSQINNINPTSIDNVYYATYDSRHNNEIMLLLLESSEKCTRTLIHEFAKAYLLITPAENRFRRYSEWLGRRNELIKGFTKLNDKLYMVADRRLSYYYSRYGFCTACGKLRCSPVWCICGHKELFDGWTSNNKQLDEFIKKTQFQTNSPNDVYLEWIPFDCINRSDKNLLLPVRCYRRLELIPLEIADETDNSYYDKLCDTHPDILTKDVWVTIGFTYNTKEQKYCLIEDNDGVCLACAYPLDPDMNAFCLHCFAPRSLNWTTGNKSLDLFIMESWSNVESWCDPYMQWIEYSLLMNVREIAPLHHGCKLIADWVGPYSTQNVKVTLKKIVDGQNAQQFNFHQLINEYPSILTPDNMWIIGITQEPCTRDYYLVFRHEIREVVDEILNRYDDDFRYIKYNDFDKLKEVGSGGYRTVYTAKYNLAIARHIPETVILKRFKNFDQTLGLFIAEFQYHARYYHFNLGDDGFFPKLYGVTQDSETKDYMMVIQYANNGSLLSYLSRNINNLTWKKKLEHLKDIAQCLSEIHDIWGWVHCNLHGGNIVLHDDKAYICDFDRLLRSKYSRESSSNVRGNIPFIAPEVFHTRKFTQKSDVYSFGVIMYLVATGEPPFRDRKFDRNLVRDIVNGLRPSMPDSAPKKYKKLAERCCDCDPDMRPENGGALYKYIDELVKEIDKWNVI